MSPFYRIIRYMETKTMTDETGRNYEAYVEGDMTIPIGPPERIVDILGLPEPFATELHNELHRRKLYTYEDVRKNPQSLQGALQSILLLDVQRLSEAYYKYEHPEV
jgi:hypothetical protein